VKYVRIPEGEATTEATVWQVTLGLTRFNAISLKKPKRTYNRETVKGRDQEVACITFVWI
jgi:hypothetical protein